jgi:hypothetical protein
MADFFQFEADFIAALRCIPMQVRLKLDTCGIKLKLHQWQKFNLADRLTLVNAPTDTAADIESYRQCLAQLILTATGEQPSELPPLTAPPWLETKQVPVAVAQRADALGLAIAPTQWQQLSPLQRFALIKLSGSSHEQNNFRPALQEFGLL